MPVYRVPVELASQKLPSSAWNIWHVRTVADPGDVGPALDALADFYTAVGGHLGASAVVKFPLSVVEVFTDTEAEIASVPADIPVTAAEMEAQGLTLPITWKTSLRARRGTGRTFLGPMNQNQTTSLTGWPSDLLRADVATAATALVAASTAGSGWSLCVLGQENKGVSTPKVARDIIGFKVATKWGFLRSRRD